ncbi:MAG: phosphogluconate dehydratase, partial [Polaromonas sp.]
MALHSAISDITARIAERSRPTRSAYLAQLQADSTREPSMDRMGCANIAHAVAGMPLDDRFKVVVERKPNIGIVTAYNDMLSAHTPLQ